MKTTPQRVMHKAFGEGTIINNVQVSERRRGIMLYVQFKDEKIWVDGGNVEYLKDVSNEAESADTPAQDPFVFVDSADVISDPISVEPGYIQKVERIQRTEIKHSPTPWFVAANLMNNPVLVSEVENRSVCYMGSYHENVKADAKRIVDCVNACQGLDYPEMQVQQLKTGNVLLELKRQELTEQLDRATNIIKAFIKEYDVQIRSGEHKLDSVYHDALLLTLDTRD